MASMTIRNLDDDLKQRLRIQAAEHGRSSADTGMAEVLVVATKRREAGNGESGKTLFVNLYHRPRNIAEAFEMARAVRQLPGDVQQGRLCIGDSETVGTYIRAPLSQGGCASLRETTLADAALGLAAGALRLPRGYDATLATTRLGDLGEKGLLDRDIAGKNSNGHPPRGPFEIIPIQGVPQYPALWGHDAKRERRLIVPPDSEGAVRPGCDDHAVRVWKATASRLHFNRDFQINSQSLTACLTPAKSIGGRAWPNFLPAQDEWSVPSSCGPTRRWDSSPSGGSGPVNSKAGRVSRSPSYPA